MQNPDHDNDLEDGADDDDWGIGDEPSDRGDRHLPGDPEPAPIVESGKGGLRVIKIWNPKPVETPAVDPGLTLMRWPERSAETVRYTALAAEHWLSRGGVLREWLRLGLWAGILLVVTALVVIPPVSMLLAGLGDWTALLRTIAENIKATLDTLPPLVVAIGIGVLGYKVVQRRINRPRPYRQHDNY